MQRLLTRSTSSDYTMDTCKPSTHYADAATARNLSQKENVGFRRRVKMHTFNDKKQLRLHEFTYEPSVRPELDVTFHRSSKVG